MNNEKDTIQPLNRIEWRQWLNENHAIKRSIWVVYQKKKTNKPSLVYSEAVEEALCFGWIDSKAKPIDDEKYMQFFCKRKEKSVWSKVNKEKIRQLTEKGLMASSGLASVEKAKLNGSWSILDDAEELIIPIDLEEAFQLKQIAKSFFQSLSRSDKRNILQWLILAKRQETRKKRIMEILEFGEIMQKPKQFR